MPAHASASEVGRYCADSDPGVLRRLPPAARWPTRSLRYPPAMRLLWITAGGALGTLARYLLEGWVQRASASAFPFGILAVNVLGSFAIGLVMTVLAERGALDSTLRLALTTGLLGGFTTYSSFNYQTLELFRAREWLSAGLYLGGTVASCLVAGALGLAAGRWLDS
jgi:fluoride exporter